MTQIISNIAAQGIETHSYFAASKGAIEFAGTTSSACVHQVKDLFDVDLSFDNDTEANIMTKYMIAEAVRLHVDGFLVHSDEIVRLARERTAKYFNDLPWFDPKQGLSALAKEPHFDDTVPVDEIKIERVTVGTKIVKPKKGAKTPAAKKIYEANRTLPNKDIIALFMKQLDMPKAGAATYLYKERKAAGDVSVGTKKGRKPKAA